MSSNSGGYLTALTPVPQFGPVRIPPGFFTRRTIPLAMTDKFAVCTTGNLFRLELS
jgi:hypothetical protein